MNGKVGHFILIVIAEPGAITMAENENEDGAMTIKLGTFLG